MWERGSGETSGDALATANLEGLAGSGIASDANSGRDLSHVDHNIIILVGKALAVPSAWSVGSGGSGATRCTERGKYFFFIGLTDISCWNEKEEGEKGWKAF